MLEILAETKDKIVATKATGKLTEMDYGKLLPVLFNKVKEYDKVRWYFEMENFAGWEFKAFWEEIKFDIKHANDFEKIAMVGEKKWQEWIADAMKPFTSSEIRYFDLDDKDAAMDWITS